MRLAVVMALVAVGDTATQVLIDRGWTMGFEQASVVRVLGALPVLHWPFGGFVFALEVDKWDWYWLQAGQRDEAYQLTYQQWDKAMDLVTLGAALIVALHWKDRVARLLALGTFVWRVAGVVVFYVTKQEATLIAFPNVFESLFLLYVLYHLLTGREQMLHGPWSTLGVMLALTLPKMAQEFFLHLLDGRPQDVWEVPIPGPLVVKFWLGVLYGPVLVALGYLVATRRGRRVRGDREADLSAV